MYECVCVCLSIHYYLSFYFSFSFSTGLADATSTQVCIQATLVTYTWDTFTGYKYLINQRGERGAMLEMIRFTWLSLSLGGVCISPQTVAAFVTLHSMIHIIILIDLTGKEDEAEGRNVYFSNALPYPIVFYLTGRQGTWSWGRLFYADFPHCVWGWVLHPVPPCSAAFTVSRLGTPLSIRGNVTVMPRVLIRACGNWTMMTRRRTRKKWRGDRRWWF